MALVRPLLALPSLLLLFFLFLLFWCCCCCCFLLLLLLLSSLSLLLLVTAVRSACRGCARWSDGAGEGGPRTAKGKTGRGDQDRRRGAGVGDGAVVLAARGRGREGGCGRPPCVAGSTQRLTVHDGALRGRARGCPRTACPSRPLLRSSPWSPSRRRRSSPRQRPPAQVAVAKVVAVTVDEAVAVAEVAMATGEDVVVVVAEE